MSRIYFHTQDERAEVSGRERGLIGQICANALLFALGDLDHSYGREPPWILKHIPKECYLHGLKHENCNSKDNSISTWLRVAHGADAFLILGDKRYHLFDLQLNSAITMGGNAFKLAARLHGQCEIHCYVEGPNRKWLAAMISDALEKSIFRRAHGWEEAIALLHKANDSPVVCSYSVCDSFPNRHVAKWEAPEGDEDGDSWYDLPNKIRWDMAIDGLRSSNQGLEMKPEEWESYWLGNGDHLVSGFDFCNQPLEENTLSNESA